jgi:hypothetical protein
VQMANADGWTNPLAKILNSNLFHWQTKSGVDNKMIDGNGIFAMRIGRFYCAIFDVLMECNLENLTKSY